MKKLMTTACLFVATAVAIVSFIAPDVFGQEKKTAKVETSTTKTITTDQADGWRTIQFETTQVTAPDVAVTPDGEWLIFTMLGKLFRLSVKGGEAEQLTFGPYYDNDPAISPDSKLVAFQSDRDGTAGNIFVLTLATKDIRQLTREIWADRPNWAPDGQSLAYLQLERKSWGPRATDPRPPAVVRRVNLAGDRPESIRPLGSVWSVFYLTDGRVAWTVTEADSNSGRVTTRIEVLNADGRITTMRTFDGNAQSVVAGPKADGLYTRYGKWDTTFQEPYIVFAPNSVGTERRIIPVSGEDARFSVSADNKTMYLGNLGHLWKIGLPGGRREAIPFRAKVTLPVRQLTAPPKWTPAALGSTRPLTIRQPLLSPDGSRIVFQALGDLWEQPVAGGQARRLLDGNGSESDVAFSPDGRQLAFMRSTKGIEEIQVLDLESGKTRTVAPTTECGWEDLTWSPNGELISSTDCGVYEIIAIDPVKLTQRVLAKTTDWTPYAQLSADGKTLHFQAKYPGSDAAFYRLQLVPAAKPELLLPVSAQGMNIVMHDQWLAHAIANRYGIWLAPRSFDRIPQTEGRLLGDADGHEFSFTSDGSALLYVSGDKLWRDALQGGARQEIPVNLKPPAPTPPPILLERVRVLDFAANGFGTETSVLIENGRIRWVGSGKANEIPKGAVTVDGGGRFAIPGLFDMHGHGGGCGEEEQITHGVTSVRNMGGRLEGQNAHADQSDFTSDAVPRCFYAGRILEGRYGGRNEDYYFVHPTTEDDARMFVRRAKTQGAHFIKLYERLPWPIQHAAADEARRLGLPVEAHGNTSELAVKGVIQGYGLTHLPPYHGDILQMFAASGTRWDPTNGIGGGWAMSFRNDPERFRRVSGANPQMGDTVLRGLWANRMSTIRSAYRLGITLMPGTDSGIQGLALQWELEFFAEAGIPPIDILRFATKEAAKKVGAEDHLGTLEAGKLADLILLDANPLEDIKNTQKIWRVFKGGWMFDPKVLSPNQN